MKKQETTKIEKLYYDLVHNNMFISIHLDGMYGYAGNYYVVAYYKDDLFIVIHRKNLFLVDFPKIQKLVNNKYFENFFENTDSETIYKTRDWCDKYNFKDKNTYIPEKCVSLDISIEQHNEKISCFRYTINGQDDTYNSLVDIDLSKKVTSLLLTNRNCSIQYNNINLINKTEIKILKISSSDKDMWNIEVL